MASSSSLDAFCNCKIPFRWTDPFRPFRSKKMELLSRRDWLRYSFLFVTIKSFYPELTANMFQDSTQGLSSGLG